MNVSLLVIFGIAATIKASWTRSIDAQWREEQLRKTISTSVHDISIVEKNFLTDFKLFHLRRSVSSGSCCPGILYFILSATFAIVSFYVTPSSSITEDAIPPECHYTIDYLSNYCMDMHFRMTRWLTAIMLILFGLVVVLKVVGILSFSVCPLF